MEFKRIFYGILLAAIFPFFLVSDDKIATVTDLVAKVDKLPTNRELLGQGISGNYTIFSANEFVGEIEAWMKMRANKMQNSKDWQASNQGQTIPGSGFFDFNKTNSFTPFTEKVSIDSGQKFLLRGDLHGDIHSLVVQLKDMKSRGLIDDNFKLKAGVNMAFLGDLVDRGNYGSEVLYTIARLGNANPDKVFYTRGNHEDINICSKYGFEREVVNKFGSGSLYNRVFGSRSVYNRVCRMYDYMPTAIYLGDTKDNYIQLCHGGVEPGYDPKKLLESDKKYQLLGLLNRKDAVDEILSNETVSQSLKRNIKKVYSKMANGILLRNPTDSDLPLGHMWNDFDATGKDHAEFKIKEGRGIECGQEAVNHMLDNQSGSQAKIIGVIRAHQHDRNPKDQMMKNLKKGGGCWNMRGCSCQSGLGNSTDKDVVTLNVSPDSVYGKYAGFDDDIALEVKPNRIFNGWSVKKHKYYPLANKRSVNSYKDTKQKDESDLYLTMRDESYFRARNIRIATGVLAFTGVAYYLYKKYYSDLTVNSDDEVEK